MTKRPVIVHFHLFKNAGTSVDRILQDNFSKDEWAEIEGPNNRKLEPEALIDFIRANPKLKAVSSHTAVVSVPDYDDVELVPIVFVRHPIDRIRSAYDFEKTQDADTPGAKFARNSTFEEYLEWRMSQPTKPQVSNFHAMRLKDFYEYTPPWQADVLLRQGKKTIKALPVVGVVDMFNVSMVRFETLIQQHFPDFKATDARENATAPSEHTLKDNVRAFRKRIGAQLFDDLKAENYVDFKLYGFAKRLMKEYQEDMSSQSVSAEE